jgi:hypothetical protein
MIVRIYPIPPKGGNVYIVRGRRKKSLGQAEQRQAETRLPEGQLIAI